MATEKRKPQRQCVGCREMKDKKDLIRLVKNQDNELFIDLQGKTNGRGAYICRSMDCFDKAYKNKSLERSLKTSIPQDTYEKLKKELMGE